MNLLSIEKECRHYQKFSPLINDWNPYVAIECEFLQGFAFKDNLFLDLASKWALYPDHIVFLGEYANRYNSFQDFEKLFPNPNDGPEIIFIKNVGVFSNPNLNEAKFSQLKCYYNVLMRLHRDYIVNELTPSHRYQLVNWDAEKYRKSIMK